MQMMLLLGVLKKWWNSCVCLVALLPWRYIVNAAKC